MCACVCLFVFVVGMRRLGGHTFVFACVLFKFILHICTLYCLLVLLVAFPVCLFLSRLDSIDLFNSILCFNSYAMWIVGLDVFLAGV